MARKKNVTFNDIAQYTHFSKTTISRYFNNPDSLTPENVKEYGRYAYLPQKFSRTDRPNLSAS